MIFSITLPNTKYGHLMPIEDAFIVKDKVFCVADGITRDPVSPIDFGNLSQEQLLKNYPNPSGATMAAKLFCKEFSEFTGKEKSIKESFIYANNAISDLNKKHINKVDYLVNDFYACVASAGIIRENKLYWGQIGDCGIIIFDKEGKVKFKTENGLASFLEYINGKEELWGKPKRRKLIRSQFRNNPKQIIDGEVVSYGALTGEKAAEFFMKFGVVDLEEGDLIVFYSDGFEYLVKQPSFFQSLYKEKETEVKKSFLSFDKSRSQKDNYKFGHERTLIATIVRLNN